MNSLIEYVTRGGKPQSFHTISYSSYPVSYTALHMVPLMASVRITFVNARAAFKAITVRAMCMPFTLHFIFSTWPSHGKQEQYALFAVVAGYPSLLLHRACLSKAIFLAHCQVVWRITLVPQQLTRKCPEFSTGLYNLYKHTRHRYAGPY